MVRGSPAYDMFSPRPSVLLSKFPALAFSVNVRGAWEAKEGGPMYRKGNSLILGAEPFSISRHPQEQFQLQMSLCLLLLFPREEEIVANASFQLIDFSLIPA